MKGRSILPLVAALFLLASLTTVQSQGLMGGFKGHHHNRGTGAVELLLATGILAKLLNHRAKHQASSAGRHLLHALIGGPRYPPRYGGHPRYPLDLHAHPALLQDDLIEPHASMSFPFSDADLMLNQESSLFSAKSPLFMSPSMPLLTEGQLMAEAQLSQQILAARRARKLLEVKKLLAAQEAKNFLSAQREAAQILAAQEAAQTTLLTATPSHQILTAAPPPRQMVQMQQMQQMQQLQQQMQQHNMHNIPQGQQNNAMGNMMTSETAHRMGGMTSRADGLLQIPSGLSESETAQLLANLHMV
ncbi:uncharacterized protein LOC118191438 [Stegodyphus dumicola]|uniref:uncharacterized protein LOC118191438 n=1 Tax=Stegodyphus dumicola TaxID=202533 RepID=UPI0015B0DA14|nr:uncharacterized protein LOC118191438 [Stegodyphus dumicola]